MQIAPSCYRRHAAQQRNPGLRCQRAKRDEQLVPEIQRIWHANWQVYGAEKVWRQMKREGIVVARCTVERLMHRLGLQGVRRGKVVRTTMPDRSLPCPQDQVNRQFQADRPNQLWVSDFTYVSTWQGWLYVAFVIDVFGVCQRSCPIFSRGFVVCWLLGLCLFRGIQPDLTDRLPVSCIT